MIHIGYGEGKRHIELSYGDLETHVHGMGVSRIGKSKLIEHIARELVRRGKGFCLIDPHGILYRDFLAWLSFVRPDQSISLLNPSDPNRVIGFNPFQSDATDEARIATKVDRMVKATTRIWGKDDATGTPRISKLLKCLYYTLIEQQLSLATVDWFLAYHEPRRDEVLGKIRSERIRTLWHEIYSATPRAFRAYIDSTESRLDAFTHPHVQRIMGLRENSIDVNRIIRDRGILLVNLQPSRDDLISDTANRIIGTLLINEIWEYMRKQETPQEFYLIIDEAQLYLTPDISEMIDQSAKYGLHLLLFHQHAGQLTTQIEKALANAQVKIRFHAKRKFTLERPGKEPVEAITPDVNAAPAFKVQEYIERLTSSFYTIEEVDARLATIRGRELARVELEHTISESPRTQIFSNAPTDISDDDLFE